MLLTDIFTDEILDEDIRKTIGAGVLGGALLASPMTQGAVDHVKPGPPTSEIGALAATIWGEARGHGVDGMNAVGHVIKNRADAHKKMFGSGIKDVVKKDKQFSCWNSGDPNRKKMADMIKLDNAIRDQQAPTGEDFNEWMNDFRKTGTFGEYKAWRSAYKIARDILDGKSDDPTNGAVYYHTTAVSPYWADQMEPVSKFANHIFYRLPKK
jgi:spore germination cell wall hydrolase CwlJ-like protein